MEKQDSVQPYAAPVQIVHSAERKLPPTPMDEADFDVDKPSDAIKKPGGGSSATSASFSSKIALAIGASLLLIAVVIVAVLVTHKVDKDNHPIDHNPSVNPPPSNDKSNHKYHFVPPSDDGVVTNPKDVLGNISLKLVSFLPASGLIYNRQAITLVFSKSVIALGSNFDDATQVPPAKLVCNGKRPIPGKWRWVTTSIARFDPDIDWPNDLTCDVAVNQSLTSWDEQVLTPTKDGSRKYGSISLTGYVSTVTSKTASAATDGTWNPYLEKHLHDALECPSDGHIEFTFPQLVNAQYVAEKLAVKENIQTVAPSLKQFVLNGTCGTSRVGVDGITYTSCIRGYVNNGGITPNTVATFTLPDGAMPTQYGGPLSKPIDLEVAGLHPFKFYFERHSYSTNRLNSRNLRMYLIHGLASGVSFEAIKPLITINVNKVKTSFVLAPQNKFDVHLEVADLFPGDDVEISVAGSTAVKDGFNQPLEASSQTYQGRPTRTNVFDLEKTGRETFPSIVFPSSRGAAEDAWALFGRTKSPGNQQYSSCNAESATYDTFNTNTNLDEVARKFGSLRDYEYPFTDKKQRYAPPKPLAARQGSIIVDIPNTVPSLVNDTATKLAVRLFNHNSQWCDDNAMFIVGSDTVLTSISTPGRLTVYASNLFTAAPVGNVAMNLTYQQRHTTQVIPAPLTATSGTDGIATFDITSNLGSRVLVATSPDASVSIAREIYARPVSRKDLGGATTDRGVYNLGDTVYLTGVMRRKENNSPYLIVPPEGTPLNLNVEWTRNNETTYPATTTKFGTFEVSFTVPYNADYTTQSVRISAPDGSIATAKFAVADPRVPTAALTLAPVGLDLQLGIADTFDVVASTRTYSGQPIQASNISLSVEIRNVHGNSRYEAQHNLYTVADGTVKKSVPLKGVDGEHATITATWVGPTRELLVKTIQVPIRAALITTSISRTADSGRAIPGVPFDALVTVDASKENTDVILASSRLVKISLYPTIAPSTTNQYQRVKDPNAAPVTDVSCMLFANTTTGDYNNLCPISLPSMGVFAAEVVAEDSMGNLATGSILLGELAVSWAMYPLRTPYPVVAKFSTTGAYTRGSNLKVVFNNPYEYTAKALYMCSDSSSALKTVEVPSGSSTIELPPSTCDCPSVGITILTPETNIIIDRKLFPVPISATADFNAPAHFDYNLSPVCADAPTDIQLTVTPSTTSTTPDSTVDAEITTTAADGTTPVEAEVTVIVTDKAMLQLNEPSVFGINEAPAAQCMYCWRYNYYNDVDAAAVWYKSESRDGYLSPAYVKTMKQRITALSQANPWLTASNMKEEQYRHMNISLANTLWPPFSLTDFPWFYTPRVPDSYITNYNNGMEQKAEMSDNMANGGMPGAGGGAGGGAMTPNPGAYPVPAPTAPPRANGDHGGSDKPSSGIHIRSAYSPTAVTMKVTTDPATGKANVKLPLNSNVGTWVVRSIAVRASGTKPVATATAEIVSRKPLQIVASVPRAVRLGDNFTAGAVASAKVAQSATVSVRMDNCHGLTLRSASSAQSVSLSSAKPLEVLFSFTAVEFDATCSLTFTITDGTHSDGIAAAVPVLAPVAGVSVGTSFVLKDTMQWNEGLAYPSAFPGGRVNIATSVGRLAAIEAVTNNMLKRQSLHNELSGYDLLDRIASFVALHPYANGGNPAVTDDNIKTAQLGATYNASRSAFLEAVYLIQAYSSNTGFGRNTAHTRYIDLSLTLSFLHTVRYVLPRSANGNSLEKLYTSAKLATAISQCEAAVIAELNNLAQNWYSRTPSPYYSALFYYTLGSAPASKFTAGKWMNVVIFPWNTLAQMAEDSSSVGLYVQSHAFATMIRDGSYAGYAKVQSDIMDNIRVTGRTAFIAYSGTGYTPSPGSSALLFEGLTLSKTTVEQQLIEKLANFVSQTEGGASANRWYYYRGGDDKIMLALSKYDLAHRVTNPFITLTVKNTSTVLKTIPYIGTESLRHVDLQSYPFTTLSKPAEQSPSGVNSTLNFTSAGTGEASVVVSLNFFPSLPVINKPRYFGLFVEKSSVIMTGKYAGQQVNGSLTPLTPGDLVKVTLAVTTADDVQSIVVTDFTTGGLEPIDAHLSGMSDLLAEANNAAAKTNGVAYGNRRKMQEQSYYPAFYGGWWWMWYFQFMVEVKSDRVVCSGYSPRAGTYECTYFATATTSGDFVVPPAQAVIVSQPEVMGMSTYTFAHVNPKKL